MRAIESRLAEAVRRLGRPAMPAAAARRWASTRRFFQKEFRILRNLAQAAEEALRFRETGKR
jgi:hypothetical protein